MIKKNRYTLCGSLLLGAANAIASTPSNSGTTGYINMPSAVVEADGTVAAGYSYDSPYSNAWIAGTVLPFLQLSGRYVTIRGVDNLSKDVDPNWRNYGDYKDKVFGLKLRLTEEGKYLPSIAVGADDVLGTKLFHGQYVVATKTFGPRRNLELSVGAGSGRVDGVFAGARWAPGMPGLSFVAEYDATDYPRDFGAAQTGLHARAKGPAAGIEYRWGWLGAQIARHRDHFSANAYISVPFSEREFVPKLLEPRYYPPKDAPPRASSAQWLADRSHSVALVQALARQDFRNIRVELDGTTLKLALTNARIADMGRAVGRAARVALAFAPEGTRALHITYTTLEQPVATYEFDDLQRLSDYLTGLADRQSFVPTVHLRYARPADRILDERESMLAELKDDGALAVHAGRDGNIVQVSSEDRESNSFKTVPKLGFFFNDPSGALRYETWLATSYTRRLDTGLYLNSALTLSLFENVSGVTQRSNSLLPHVRTDIAEYKRPSRVKLSSLMLNKYLQLDERWYARASAGLYEEMYRGAGGQVLYLPKASQWAADISVDALQQRGFKGWLDKRDYKTVTALAALHYRLPYDVTATVRAGRFLARDTGVRLELKRHFRSGFEMGVWYTKTNGNDITNPGAPNNPYNDKGVFLSVPLNIMMPSDTRAVAGFSMSPWTRDVGQMVASPGDLYDMVEQPRSVMTAYDGLGNFAERADEQNLPVLAQPVRGIDAWAQFRMRVDQSASSVPAFPQWVAGSALAAGAIGAGALLDKPADKFFSQHAGSRPVRAWGKFGKFAPVALAGGAGAAFAFGDQRMSNTGLIALESVALSLGLSTGTKYVAGRARPEEGQGPWAHTSDRSNASFPSNHASVAFAAVTPFAKEYDAPWLYGLAAASSMGRVAARQHWVSDVVAGSLLGYAVGNWLWDAQRKDSTSSLVVAPGPKEIRVAWSGSY